MVVTERIHENDCVAEITTSCSGACDSGVYVDLVEVR